MASKLNLVQEIPEDLFKLQVSFLSDPIRSLAILVTNSLTNSCFVNLIDVGLACEDGNSKFVEDVDDEKQFNFTW